MNKDNNKINIPNKLKDFVYIYEGKVCAKQKLPKELEKDYEEFIKSLKNK